MKKFFFLINLLTVFLSMKIFAGQVNQYSYSQSVSSYVEIPGGNVIAFSTSTSGPASIDDIIFPALPLPFSFTFNNITYNSYTVSSNGYITFGTTSPTNTLFSPISSTVSYDGAISCLGRDLQGVMGITANRTIGSNVMTNVSSFHGIEVGRVITGSGIPVNTTVVNVNPSLQQITISNPSSSNVTNGTAVVASGEIRTATTGLTGSRVHTIQWKNFRKFGAFNDHYNFQISLYETTNQIKLTYGTCINGTTPGQAQVGLRGAANTDYLNRKTLPPNPNWLSTSGGINNFDTCRLSSGSVPMFGLSMAYARDLPDAFYIFYQNNFDYGGLIHSNSDWGTVKCTLPQFIGVKYFNLSVNAPGVPVQWQIQNAILQNFVSSGNNTYNISFDIGDIGINVTSVNYGITVTDNPAILQPAIDNTSPVLDFNNVVYNGSDTLNYNAQWTPEPAVPYINYSPTFVDKAQHEDFPNQECPYKYWCVPTGISNSLLFLNAKHDLGLDTGKLSIKQLGKALGTNSEKGTPTGEVDRKKAYLEKNKIPITTREKGPQNIDDIIQEIKNGQDVEIMIDNGGPMGHFIAVTGIVKIDDAKYQIVTSSDEDQGNNGGLKTNEVNDFHLPSRKFTGGHFKGWKLKKFLVECPNKLKTNMQNPSNNSNNVSPASTFNWDPVQGASSYWLEIAKDINFDSKVAEEDLFTQTFYVAPVFTFTPLTDYFWRVRVNDSAGPGTYDTCFKFTTSDFLMQNPAYQFFQNDYNLGNHMLYDSDWGTLVITLPYFNGLKYVNLTTNTPGTTTQWQIQNGIMQNHVSPDKIQEHSFTFDIGDRGIDISNISFGIEITSMPLMSAPLINSTAPVSPRIVGVRDGVGIPVSYPVPEPPYAKPFECPIDPDLVDSAAHEDFPNQECPYHRWCTPTAISNSLKFLNKKHDLKMDTNKISIDSIAKAIGTDSATGSPEDWPSKKRQYMEDRNLPITTRELPPGDVKNIKKEILNGQDVEIDIDNDTTKHTACVTGIVDLGNGKYEISTSDDTEQGTAGGLSTNAKSTYDTTDKKFTGGELSEYKIVRFIVECPNKNKTTPGSPSNNQFSVPSNTPFSWSAVPGADSYWLEVSASINFVTKVIDNRNVPGSTYLQQPVVLQPGTTYFWRVRVNDSAGPGSYDTVFTFSTASSVTLNLTVLIEGLYNASSNMMMPDTGKVNLRNITSPYSIVDSAKALLNISGNGTFNFNSASNGNYYIDFRHRNSIQTWSSAPQLFTAGVASYNFSNMISKAFGNNQIQVDASPVRFAVYSADVNQDETVDVSDLILIYNDALNFAGGYISTDVNGDGFADVQDLIMAYNNSINLVTTIRP